jgi:hypothetical protein
VDGEGGEGEGRGAQCVLSRAWLVTFLSSDSGEGKGLFEEGGGEEDRRKDNGSSKAKFISCDIIICANR